MARGIAWIVAHKKSPQVVGFGLWGMMKFQGEER